MGVLRRSADELSDNTGTLLREARRLTRDDLHGAGGDLAQITHAPMEIAAHLAGATPTYGDRFTLAAGLLVRPQPAAQRLGVALRSALAESDLAGADETALIYAAGRSLAEREAPSDTGTTPPHLYAVRDEEGNHGEHDST